MDTVLRICQPSSECSVLDTEPIGGGYNIRAIIGRSSDNQTGPGTLFVPGPGCIHPPARLRPDHALACLHKTQSWKQSQSHR
jgi:hypothetical protein